MAKKGTDLERLERDEKNLTRRQFLQKIGYAGKVVASGTLYGAIGNVGGRITEGVINAYESTRDAISQIKDTLDKPKEVYNRIFRRNEMEEDSENQETPKDTSRRGFIRSLLSWAYENPVKAGTILGTGYGSGKQSIKSYSSHRDQLTRLEERKERTKDRIERLALSKEIEELRREIAELTKEGNSNLEKRIGEGNKTILMIGLTGIFISLIFGASSMTGFSIIEINSVSQGIISILIFLVSLLLIKLGLIKS